MSNEAPLHGRHRDKNGEISRKHGNTLVRTLRKIYGPRFAPGAAETDTLSDVLSTLPDFSLSELVRDHEHGHLDGRIRDTDEERAQAMSGTAPVAPAADGDPKPPNPKGGSF